MENIIAIGAGLVLRTVIDILTDNDNRLTSTLIGLWEGIVLSHFLHKNPRNSSDAYLGLATRFAIDFMITNSLVRFALTAAWTVVGLLLSDIAPSVWRQTGLRHMYKALKKDVKAMRRAVPQWRIENDIKVPNISISNPVPGLFSRPAPSTIASSTRAAPPTSPALIPERRPQSSTSTSQVTSSDINTLTREVIPGPSPALFPTADHPASFDSDSYSPRTSLLSNSTNIDPSRLDPIPIPDDLGVHIAPSSHSQEQEQVQEPELSALDILLPIAAIQVTTANVEIISPTPVTSIRALPPISDIDLSVPAHQVPLPPSRPASRVNTAGSPWRGNVRAHAEKVGSDLSPDYGKPYHQRASSTGVFGQGQNHLVDNRPSSTGHQRIDSNSRRRERSNLGPSEENWRRGVVEQVLDRGATTAPVLSDSPATESFVGGFIVPPQRSGTPRDHTGPARANSALGLTTTLPPSNAPTPPPKSKSSASVPYIKPPTPALQTHLTTAASYLASEKAALRSKSPTIAPQSKSTTPKPKSDCPTPDPSATNRTSCAPPTDYNPAEPVRPMPGLKSPSTEPDSIFGGGAFGGGAAPFNSSTRRREYASGDFDIAEHEVYDPPPPFKEFESPVNVQGEGVGGRQEGAAEGDGQHVATDENTGEVGDVGVQETGDGAQGGGETSQDAGEHTRSPGENTAQVDEGAGENLGGVQEQEESKEEETKGDHGAGDGNQGVENDSQDTGKGVEVAGESASVTGGDTQVTAAASDPASEPTPTVLTPEQTEAETHRAAFLNKEVSQLEKRNPLGGAGRRQNQARLDALKGRIARTIFADPSNDPPPAPELPTIGKAVTDLPSELAEMVVELLLSRQDVEPIEVILRSSNKKRQDKVEQALKAFVTENNFSMNSDKEKFVTVITV